MTPVGKGSAIILYHLMVVKLFMDSSYYQK